MRKEILEFAAYCQFLSAIKYWGPKNPKKLAALASASFQHTSPNAKEFPLEQLKKRINDVEPFGITLSELDEVIRYKNMAANIHIVFRVNFSRYFSQVMRILNIFTHLLEDMANIVTAISVI